GSFCRHLAVQDLRTLSLQLLPHGQRLKTNKTNPQRVAISCLCTVWPCVSYTLLPSRYVEPSSPPCQPRPERAHATSNRVSFRHCGTSRLTPAPAETGDGGKRWLVRNVRAAEHPCVVPAVPQQSTGWYHGNYPFDC